MSEKIFRFFQDPGDGTTLRADGTPATFTFDAAPAEGVRYRLFFAGESAIYTFWKNEPDFQWQYHTIADALDTTHAFKAQYCLDLSSDQPESYVRRLYRKVSWPPRLSYLRAPSSDRLRAGLWVRAEGLAFAPGGFLRMCVEVRRRHEGVNPASVERPPDNVFTLDIPAGGDGRWREHATDIAIPGAEVVHLSVLIEGAGYSGGVFIERPFLTTDTGWNLLPDFAASVPDKQKFDWTAQYISRKEWPRFRIDLNGEKIFEGEVFERCHLNSEWEIPLPPGAIRRQNRLSVALVSRGLAPLPYTLHEAALIDEPAGRVVLVATGEVAPVGGKARLLFETAEDDVSVHIASHSPSLAGGDFTFAKAGLHGVLLDCLAPGLDARFTVSWDGGSTEGAVQRIVVRPDDGVVTGTGDMVYIHQDFDSVHQFLKWYLAEGVGDLVTARPTYRWSGSRLLAPDVWRDFARVLNELGMSYVHMWDGRELPGQNANPDASLLAGPGFLGSQTHERDGARFYWGVRASNYSRFLQQLWEMQQRVHDEDPDHVNPQYCHANYWQSDGEMYWHKPPGIPSDAREAHDLQVAHLSTIRRNAATRHTGPTILFRAFLDAGYKWFGFEGTYSTLEPAMAFLRGAARFGGVRRPGVHLAIQWSSSPHDAPEHARRYRLALYGSYIQGAGEINTEEGLWHIEEYYAGFNRFSGACRAHLAQQQDFFRYVAANGRTGAFHTPVALLQDRLDGWHGFARRSPWGIDTAHETAAGRSWQLLKVFYPGARPGEIVSRHYCPTDRDPGFNSATPLGCVDVIPADSPANLLGSYRALAFMGYACAETATLDRLLAYVCGGGRLLLTRAHLSDATAFADVDAGRLTQVGHPLAFADGTPEFREDAVGGRPVRVCANALPAAEVAARTDGGLPLVTRRRIGLGEVTLVEALAYPGDDAIQELYAAELRRRAEEETAREPVWAETGDDDVSFALYRQEDGSAHVYFLAVDWFRDPAALRHAVLRVGADRYGVALPFGVLVRATVRDGRAVWPLGENGGVLSLEGATAVVQGTGACDFACASNGATHIVTVDFSEKPVQELQVEG